MQETQVRSQCGEDLLERGMANHSSILAWRIPRTEELGEAAVRGGHRKTRLSDSAHDITWFLLFLCLYLPG